LHFSVGFNHVRCFVSTCKFDQYHYLVQKNVCPAEVAHWWNTYLITLRTRFEVQLVASNTKREKKMEKSWTPTVSFLQVEIFNCTDPWDCQNFFLKTWEIFNSWPVINVCHTLIQIFFWDSIFGPKTKLQKCLKNLLQMKSHQRGSKISQVFGVK
jgi:hypothetical protein